jgi:hypothetical protein
MALCLVAGVVIGVVGAWIQRSRVLPGGYSLRATSSCSTSSIYALGFYLKLTGLPVPAISHP